MAACARDLPYRKETLVRRDTRASREQSRPAAWLLWLLAIGAATRPVLMLSGRPVGAGVGVLRRAPLRDSLCPVPRESPRQLPHGWPRCASRD